MAQGQEPDDRPSLAAGNGFGPGGWGGGLQQKKQATAGDLLFHPGPRPCFILPSPPCLGARAWLTSHLLLEKILEMNIWGEKIVWGGWEGGRDCPKPAHREKKKPARKDHFSPSVLDRGWRNGYTSAAGWELGYRIFALNRA